MHFVDELEIPRYNRRPRSLSRHSSVEAVIESRPRSYSRRRRPLYYDGATDSRIDGIKTIQFEAMDEIPSAQLDKRSAGEAGPLQRPVTSEDRHTTSGTPREYLAPKTIDRTTLLAEAPRCVSNDSYARIGHAGLGGKHYTLNGHTKTPASSQNIGQNWRLIERARAAFSEPAYEVDPQFPSPPPVTFAVPVPRSTRTTSALPVHAKSPRPVGTRPRRRTHQYSEPLSPAYSNGGLFTAVPRQAWHSCIHQSSRPLSPPDSNEENEVSPASLVSPGQILSCDQAAAKIAENPNHPDHLAYLLSTAQLSDSAAPEAYPEVANEHQKRQSVSPDNDQIPEYHKYTAPGSTIPSLAQSSEALDLRNQAGFEFSADDASPGGSISDLLVHPSENSDSLKEDHTLRRSNALRDIFDSDDLEERYYESQVDYQAEGRAHIEALNERMHAKGEAVY